MYTQWKLRFGLMGVLEGKREKKNVNLRTGEYFKECFKNVFFKKSVVEQGSSLLCKMVIHLDRIAASAFSLVLFDVQHLHKEKVGCLVYYIT